MMIEPPRQAVRGGVLEVNDDVLVFPEHLIADMLAGLVGQPFVFNCGFGIDVSGIEARKYRRRRDSIKTVVVIQNSYFLHFFSVGPVAPRPYRSKYLAIV